jgi:anaphase-promoting complex subunit 5
MFKKCQGPTTTSGKTSAKQLVACGEYRGFQELSTTRQRKYREHDAQYIGVDNMARYLTPSKVGLLALISLYSDSVVPTAATIPVLSFLVSHLIPSEASRINSESTISKDFVVGIEDFQKATITHASGIPGRTIWDLLLKKIWEINCHDALEVFFERLPNLLVKPRDHIENQQNALATGERMQLSRSSPLGTFVRRCMLEFTRLQFHDSEQLWKALIVYREPTQAMWRKRNPHAGAGKAPFDINLRLGAGMESRLMNVVYGDLFEPTQAKKGSVSTDDAERLLEWQVEEMQSKTDMILLYYRPILMLLSSVRDG